MRWWLALVFLLLGLGTAAATIDPDADPLDGEYVIGLASPMATAGPNPVRIPVRTNHKL